MSLNKTILLAIALLVAFLDTDVTSAIIFVVCYARGREIERTGKPDDAVRVEQAMVHTDVIETGNLGWDSVCVSTSTILKCV